MGVESILVLTFMQEGFQLVRIRWEIALHARI